MIARLQTESNDMRGQFLVHASGDLHKANEMLVDLLVLYPLGKWATEKVVKIVCTCVCVCDCVCACCRLCEV